MRKQAAILLGIVRDANKNRVTIPPDVIGIIRRQLGITETELDEITEILKADIRELNAMYPAFPQVNEQLRRMSPENPKGE